MKAAQITNYGGPELIQINDVDMPVADDDKVLIKVAGSSLNPFDTMVREGHVKQMIKSLPITLGGDVSGTVVAVGDKVTNVSVGDKVYGQAAIVAGNSGALAEYAVTVESQISQAPKTVSLTNSAAYPLVGASALQAIYDHIDLQPGQKILIHGGGGGIGSIAVQLAKHIGAYVAVTVSPEDIGYVKGLGADEIIDYTKQDFAEIIHDYDAVFDTVGGDVLSLSLPTLKRGGKAVSMIGSANEAKANELGVTAITQNTKVLSVRLSELAKLVDAGIIKVRVGATFPLDRTQEAFAAREAGTRGKVVVSIG